MKINIGFELNISYDNIKDIMQMIKKVNNSNTGCNQYQLDCADNLLEQDIGSLNSRIVSVLYSYGIYKYKDLIKHSRSDLQGFVNFGKKSADMISDYLSVFGLSLSEKDLADVNGRYADGRAYYNEENYKAIHNV